VGVSLPSKSLKSHVFNRRGLILLLSDLLNIHAQLQSAARSTVQPLQIQEKLDNPSGIFWVSP